MEGKANIVSHLFEEVKIQLPYWRYFEIFRSQPYAYFLDSSLAENSLGTYSFMGGNPFLVYKAYLNDADRDVAVERFEVVANTTGFEKQAYTTSDLFGDLRKVFNNHSVAQHDLLKTNVPFHAGAVGYLAYEAGSLIENIPVAPSEDVNVPVACFLFVDHTFCYCHTTHKAYLSVVVRADSQKEAHELAQRKHGDFLAQIANFEKQVVDKHRQTQAASQKIKSVDFKAQHDLNSYSAAINTIKDEIYEGSVYEVCLTHQYSCVQEKEPWKLYQALRKINPAPFSSYLKLPEVDVVCSSPERFLRLDPEGEIESRPIKGTRRRGNTKAQDDELKQELETSEKDRAENLMIVDLVRNDLSRVSEIGSVHVPQLLKVEQYATVLQLVSAIKGQLKKEYDAFDLIQACFPGGSMTGAPKIEAMKIIASLEKSQRGIYSGAIGYLDFSGAMDLNIVIRSIVVKGGRCYFNVGGAIVSDSNPTAEYEETLDKARALVAALKA